MKSEVTDVVTTASVRTCLRDLLTLFAALVLVLWLLMGPGLFDLYQPVPYSGDGLSHGLLVKTILDVGWFPVHSPWVGAPFGADMHDIPFSDGLNFLLIKLLGVFSADWVVVANSFYLAGYFLSGATAYLVFRRLGVTSALAIAGALLFAVLPYHWMRRAHLLLSAYMVVPLGVWLAFLAWTPGPQVRSMRNVLGGALLVILVGSGGVYYAFFSAFLVIIASICRVLRSNSLRQGIPGFLCAAAIAAVVAVNIVPSIQYRLAHGPNPEAITRHPAESETYGLRLTQMVLPHLYHRVEAMRQVANRYTKSAALVNENVTSSLGIAGTIGLLLLAVAALRQLAGGAGVQPSIQFLTVMALACFLLGTIGGAGALVAHFVSPLIRAYNRVSVFVGFVSIAGLMLSVQMAVTRGNPSTARSWGMVAVALAIAVVGALDQLPQKANRQIDPSFASDRAFVRTAESLLPPGTMVWQLPYHPFPEGGPVQQMEDYGPLRGYLNSTSLRWSYGAVKGRDANRWIHAVAGRPLPIQIDLAAQSGFGAVYVDRRAYADRGVTTEALLRAKLGAPLVESADQQLAIYRLQPTGSNPLALEDVSARKIDTPIRFDGPVLDGGVASVSGLSGVEPWGRWTDGPVARIFLSRDLPPRFTLRIETAMALPPSVNVDIGVRVGEVTRYFRVPTTTPAISEIQFEIEAPSKSIELLIPNPRSPTELGMNSDGRKLGIGLQSITIIPRP